VCVCACVCVFSACLCLHSNTLLPRSSQYHSRTPSQPPSLSPFSLDREALSVLVTAGAPLQAFLRKAERWFAQKNSVS